MKKLLKFAAIFALLPFFVMTSCNDDNDDPQPTPSKGTFEDLKNHMVANDFDLPALLDGWVIAPKMVADGGIVDVDFTIPDYHVFDIRGEADFNAGHIKEAVNVALGDVLTEAVNYADKPILVVCYSGQTAGRAVMALRLSGYEAKVMKFGFSYWTSDTVDVSGEQKSFDKWTPKIGNIAVGNANWTTDASEALPELDYPTWETDATDGAEILAERVQAMLGMEWTTSSATVLESPTDYNIYNFWSSEDYLAFGHYVGAYQIKPISIADDVIKAFPNNDEFQVYCYTGQTSSFTTAWLHVLGYSAKSITYGVNSLSYTALDEAEKPAWHHSFEYEYEVTTK